VSWNPNQLHSVAFCQFRQRMTAALTSLEFNLNFLHTVMVSTIQK